MGSDSSADSTSGSPTDRLPGGTRIGRTALRVADLDETTAFYRDVVGLAVLDRDADEAVLGVDGSPLLVLERDADRPDRGRTDAGLFHNAFRVPSRSALGEALARVRARWRLDGASDHRVSEALYFDDPEGNGVEIYHDRPRVEWPVDVDGTVIMTTEPLDLDAIAAAAGDTGGTTADANGGTVDADGPATDADGTAVGDLVDRVPSGTDVGHVHLEVTSLSAFETAHVEGLGFEVGMTGPDVRFVAAGGYHHHLGANTRRGRTTPATGRGLSWFEVVVPDVAALEAVRERLAAIESTDGIDVAVDETTDGLRLNDADGIEVRVRTR